MRHSTTGGVWDVPVELNPFRSLLPHSVVDHHGACKRVLSVHARVLWGVMFKCEWAARNMHIPLFSLFVLAHCMMSIHTHTHTGTCNFDNHYFMIASNALDQVTD